MDPVSVTIARQRLELDQRPRRRPDRGVLPIALLISAALHVLVLSLGFDVPIRHRDVANTPGAIGGGTAPAMRAYDIVAAEYAAPTPRAAVVQRDIEVRPTTVTELTATSPDHQRGLTLPVGGVRALRSRSGSLLVPAFRSYGNVRVRTSVLWISRAPTSTARSLRTTPPRRPRRRLRGARPIGRTRMRTAGAGACRPAPSISAGPRSRLVSGSS